MSGLLQQIDVLSGIGLLDTPVEQTRELEREVVQLFDELRDRMLRYLLGFGLPMADCEEIVQEAFLALFLHLRKGRSRRNLRSWLFRVAHNQALKGLESNRRKARHLAECRYPACDPAASPEDEVSRNQMQQRLQAIYQALPERGQRCLALRAEGFTYREIADILDISLGAVAISLGRSLARMAEAAKRSSL